MAIKFLNTVQVDTDVLYVDAANDRVGIGLSSPSTTLHVVGFTRMNGGLQMNIANAQIYQILDSALRFGTNNTERMRISSTGNVGIGTTSPSQKLHVDGNARVTGAYYDSGNTPGTANQLLASTATGTAWIDPSTIVAEAATLVVIACKNTSGAAIAQGTPVYQTGTVGATATIEIAPADALISANKLPAIGLLQTDLNNNGFGNVVITGELTNFTTSPIDGVVPTTGDKIFVKSGGGLTLTKPTGEGNGIQNMGLVGKVSSGNSGSVTVSSIMRTNDVPNLPEGRIWIGDGNTIVSDTVYVDEPNNRVGIGTTSPSVKLEVDGRVKVLGTLDVESDFPRINLTDTNNDSDYSILNANGSFRVYDDSNDIERLSISSSGNVGIGTTSPQEKLHVYNAGAARIEIEGTNDSTAFKATNNAGSYGWYVPGANNSFRLFNFGTSSDLVTVNASGNVGIGTTSPSASLQIGSAVSTSSEKLDVRGNSSSNYVASFEQDHITGYGVLIDTDGTLVGEPALKIRNTSSELFYVGSNGNVGIGTDSPKGKLHVLNGTAGTYAPDSESDTLVVESATPGGISLIGTGTGSASKQSITFGTTSDTTSARIIYNSNSSFLSIGTTTASNFVKFVSGNGVTALTLDASQNATFAGTIGSGSITSTGIITAATTFKTDSGSMLFFVPNVGQAFEIAQNTGDATFTTQAFATVATSSGDASSTLTTKGYVDGLITGATIYRGAWDPSGGGYGSPDLSTVTQTSGYYYICSAAGTAEPNGTGTEPDTWETGDWVIYNDVSGTGQWQKIDNSSVLSGVGTGQTVALWEGAGSVTDSETLGNAPITVSGNDTTFAGSVSAEDNIYLTDAGTVRAKLLLNASDRDNVELRAESLGSTMKFFTVGTEALELDASQNATFSGDITISKSDTPLLQLVDTTNNVSLLLGADDSNTFLRSSSGSMFFQTNGSTSALTLDASQNATFAGDVYIPEYIYHSGDTNTYIRFTADTQTFRTGGDDRLILTNSLATLSEPLLIDGVSNYTGLEVKGIGSSRPSVNLSNAATGILGQVYATESSALVFATTTSGTTALTLDSSQNATFAGTVAVNGSYLTVANASNPYIYVNDTNAGSGIFQQEGNTTRIGSDSNTQVVLVQNNATAVTIDTSKNVGIGTTNPSAFGKFVVSGSGNLLNLNATSGKVYQAFYENGAGRFYLNTLDGSDGLAFTDGDGATERMRIDSDGNVGIGRSSSITARLFVEGPVDTSTISTSSTPAARINNGGAISNWIGSNGYNYGYIQSIQDDGSNNLKPLSLQPLGGNVGIGTTSPVYKLVSSITSPGYSVVGQHVSGGQVGIYSSTGDNGIGTVNNYNFNLFTNNSGPQVTLTTAGNVGIGTTSPATKLQVAGGIQMADDTDTASATKVGTMRYRTGTEYVEVTGTELVTNGDFATDSDWTKGTGWTISGGTANAATATSDFTQTVSFTLGQTYRLTYTVSNYSAGALRTSLGAYVASTPISANGNYTDIFTPTNVSSNSLLYFEGQSGFTGSIDNVSLIEVTAEDASYADMCMQTGASTYEWVNIVRNTY